jgi:hypothetical protein
MVNLTPPLMWIPDLADSLGRALGCAATYQVHSTVNPLMYTIVFDFSEPQESKYLLQVWNLIQMYAAKNDSVTRNVKIEPRSVHAEIGVKRRLGPPRTSKPWA